ncbi:MAG: extracellular solute-binding protein [Clostridia bacterium]|nr:extracellular solute-binding protein [Clostridia bacterium]
MRSNKGKKLGAIALAALMLGGTAAAAGCSKSSNKLQFWIYGDERELETYTLMTEKFNATYGKDHGIAVEISAKPAGSYTSLIQNTARAESSADIFFVIEDFFKQWVEMGFMQDLTEYFKAIDDIDVSDISENTLLKYRYDEETEFSTSESPLYGMPVDTRPTALYYNEDVFEKAGITVISVNEEDMDKWNAGEIPDLRGKYKRDYSKIANITVPKKGYFRSGTQYTENDGWYWEKPANDEILVFNNRIPMNWDEIEDLGMIFSVSKNPDAKRLYGTEYGYYTEWWFNYGWSVGGDCLADLTGTGYWNFSLLEETPNYMVEADEYTGAFTGTKYKKGDFLEMTDKLAVEKGQRLVPDAQGGYTLNGEKVGLRAAIETDAAAGKLTAYPSIREAFERYARLGTNDNVLIGDSYGLQLSPTPSVFSSSGRISINYFIAGDLAMVVEQSSYIPTVVKSADFQWDLAPLPQYKEYEDPSDNYNDTVVRRGKLAGHSNSRGLVTRKKSAAKKGDQIARFIMWMASEDAQQIRAQNGLFPNQESLNDQMDFGENAPTNMAAFSDAMKYQTPADWWYLKAFTWIDIWSVPLNTKLRNNVEGYTYQDWIDEVVSASNKKLYEDYILDKNK